MATSGTDLAQMANARANVYGLLAEIYREEPSVSLLTKLREPEFSTVLQNLGLSPQDMFEETSPGRLAEDLALEFTRLFLGPGPHLSPNESMHVEARFGESNAYWSKQTVEVKKFMEAAGITLAEDFCGMPDHISAEFEFMQMLLEKEAQAWNTDDEDLAANVQQVQKMFYDEHLSRWVDNFCDKVIGEAKTVFYAEMAAMTKAFMAFEGEIFTIELPECAVG